MISLIFGCCLQIKEAAKPTLPSDAIDLILINPTFKQGILGGHFLFGEGSRSARRKPPTFDRKTDNPSQLRLASSAPAQAGFELTTSVLTG